MNNVSRIFVMLQYIMVGIEIFIPLCVVYLLTDLLLKYCSMTDYNVLLAMLVFFVALCGVIQVINGFYKIFNASIESGDDNK